MAGIGVKLNNIYGKNTVKRPIKGENSFCP